MNASARLVASVLVFAGLAALLPGATALAADTSSPAAARYYPFIGEWLGRGQMTEAGQKPVDLALGLSCAKTAGGWAVRCAMRGQGKGVSLAEADLFGVDPVTGRGHWYAVTNQGDTHDHLVTWKDAKTMTATYSWTQDGKRMKEDITVTLPAEKTMEFHDMVSANGKTVSEFTGKFKQ